MNEFRTDTDDTILIIGGLLATAINLVRDPQQGEAYGRDPEDFIELADRIASEFISAAFKILAESPSRYEEVLRDCHDVAATMASGCKSYESYRPIKGEPAPLDVDAFFAELKADNKDFN